MGEVHTWLSILKREDNTVSCFCVTTRTPMCLLCVQQATSAVKEQKQTSGLMVTNIHSLETLLLNLKYMGLWSGGCACTVATYECNRRGLRKAWVQKTTLLKLSAS